MRKAGCQDAVMRGVVVLILAAKAQVILESKGGRISIRSQFCMICMISERETRQIAVKTPKVALRMAYCKIPEYITTLSLIRYTTSGGPTNQVTEASAHDLYYDWLTPLSERVI